MFMLICWFKIVYYAVLILYQLSDIYFDGHQSYELICNGTFSGFHVNNNRSLPYKLLLLPSSAFGIVFSLVMVELYVYYIYHHLKCIDNHSDYRSVAVAYHADDDYGITSLLTS